MNFLPKKDLVYGVVIWSVPIIMIPFLVYFYSLTILIIFILSVLHSLWIWNSTVYKIENGELYIKSWILRRKIDIQNIKEIKKTKNVWSSYALSTERLEISENGKSTYYVAPLEFKLFIEELKKYNSNIVVS